MLIADGSGLPVAAHIDAASPHEVTEVTPVGKTLKARFVPALPLRRYKRRWKVERLNAWLQNFRRVTVRWEQYATSYLGMVHLTCMMILLRHL